MTTRKPFTDPIEAPDLATKVLAKDGSDDAGYTTVADVLGVNVTTLAKAIDISHIASGVPADQHLGLNSGFNFNHIYVQDNGVDATGFAVGSKNVSGLKVDVLAYNPASIGHGIYATHNVVATPVSASASLNQYVAGQFIGQVSVNCGGDAITSSGASFGLGCTGIGADAATFLENVTGMEANVILYTGCSSERKSGISIANLTPDQVSGSVYDAGLSISGQTGAIGFINGILFSTYNGQHPCKTTGTLLKTQGAATADMGIDFSSYTFTTSFLNGPGGFSVSGAGAVVAASVFASGFAQFAGQKFTTSDTTNGNLTLGPLSAAAAVPYIDFHFGGALNIRVQNVDDRVLTIGTSLGRCFDVHDQGTTVVNRIQVLGSHTTAAPILQVFGDDTNIDFKLITKGTGVLSFGTHTGSGDVAVSGYITIKDAGGTVRKLAVIT